MNVFVKPVLVLAVSALYALNVQAQEAVTSELDSCISSEKLGNTAKGAVTGAVTGLLGSILSGKKDHMAKAVVVGAVAGGAIGYATAHYKAAGNCMQKNPSWVPESQLQRNPNFDAVVNEFGYKPENGDFVVLRKLQMPTHVKAGSPLNVQSAFVVLTPDGGEAKVRMVRKLFVIADNKQEEVPFYGKGDEQRVVENGEHYDSISLPVDKAVPAGSRLKLEYWVAVKDQPFVAESAIVEVQ